MKETKLQQHELDIIQANEGMKLYLRGLSTGKDFTPRSSLYNIKGKTKMLEPDDILAEWLNKLSVLQNGDSFEQEVFQFDSHQLEKWGPQGGVAPIDDLLEDIVYPTFNETQEPSAFSSDEWHAAKGIVSSILRSSGCVSLRPAPYARVVDDMRARDTLESNSGWPLFTRRNKPEVVTQSIEEAEDGRWKTYPAIALFRNYNGKTRLVWMFPMSANLVEGSFFQPLQSILMHSEQATQFLAPWHGFETVRQRMTDAYSSPNNFASAASDFSSTDAHFQLYSSLEVFDVISKCFQPKFRDALKESIVHMHNIPLVIGMDRQIVGEHGVSSGSNWTNFIETIFDWIFSYYVLLKEQNRSNRHNDFACYEGWYAIGDDMSWVVRRNSYDAEFSARLEAYGEEVGQLIKAEKTTNYPDKVTSLQRLFMRGYLRADNQLRAIYPTIRALKSLVYPERNHKKKLWSRDMAAIRAIMILENCVDHPLFEDFVKFVAQGDPHLAEFAKYSARRQAQLFRKSKLVPGLNPTYNQERRDSRITDFATVQLLRTL